MIILNIFEITLIFYVFLHNFKHLTAQDYFVDDHDLNDDPANENPTYYHRKDPSWITPNGNFHKKKTSRRTARPSRTTASSRKAVELQQDYVVDDYEVKEDPDDDNPVYYHVKEATWVTPKDSGKKITSTSSSNEKSTTLHSSTYISTKSTTTITSTSTSHPITSFKDTNSTRASKERHHLNETDHQRDYTNYSVLLITPASTEQLVEILEFEYIYQDYNFLSHRRVSDSPLMILLPPNDTRLRLFLRKHKIYYTIMIENLGKVFELEKTKLKKQIPPSLTGISFNMYLRYDFVMDYMTHLSVKYSEIAKVIKIGKTIEGRDIAVLEVKGLEPSEKFIGAIFIQAGMHGREWLGVSTALYVIHQLVEHASANKDMFDGFIWYILPILNADGYEYSHTTDRLWKNNRRQYENCTGVDLDRNFDVGDFENPRRSIDKLQCTNLYPSATPGTEPETQALKRFLRNNKNIVAVFISLHSGDPFIGCPWAYKMARSTDYEQIAQLGTCIKDAIEDGNNSTIYKVDRLYSLCGKYDGAAIDWAKSEGILYPLMVSLKGGSVKGFDVPSEQIFDTVSKAFEGIRAVAKHLHTSKNLAILIEQRDGYFLNNSSTVRYFLYGILIWLSLGFLI